MAEQVDFAAEGLLDGMQGPAREARQTLLRELHDDGVALEELRKAVAEDRLALVPVDRLMDEGGQRYTTREIAERSGLSVEQLHRARAAFGLPLYEPDERTAREEDLEAACRLRAVLEAGITEEAVLEFIRVVGRTTAQVAASARTMVLESALENAGGDERELGRYWLQAATHLGPLVEPVLGYAYNEHLRELVRSEAVAAADIVAGRTPGAREIFVAFADLVGFTRLGESIPAEALGDVARRLEGMAGEVMRAPVRLVKTVGDAVMLVSSEAAPLLEATLSLVEHAESEGPDYPQLRAGVAAGPALERSGDWFGTPVNLASRVTALARAASVLVTEPVKEAAAGDPRFSISSAGTRKIRGMSEPVPLFRVRRAIDVPDGEHPRAAPERKRASRKRAKRKRA